ncbi:hypothetical protein W97_02701 [Coniosporium apollinis CBS 100218]|uniref:Uncharacterized protein n=1 Tax=Coniosporium apollinis (strain CBS 100218) TaxID=1168221 RepID=R7YNN4_CONA1|nr:uncharacterized protein W97_02701 [Coniosporium apollinis CBS 100218]EON63473.1 hypothetical protein W97_02701 [Coniosporium apollinis CBS 100218]
MATPNASRMRVWKGSQTPGTASKTPSKSPTRRVLGDLTPNARTTPAKLKGVEYAKTQTASRASPLKENVAFENMATAGAKLSPQTWSAVNPRKRTIHEVDGAVGREGANGRVVRRSINEHGAGRAMVYQHAASVQASQRRPGLERLESTQSLSSTDADSPEPVPASQGTIASKASFSSLIEYDPAVSPPHSQRASSSPPAIVETAAAKSQADTLRLRLRIAMYKVRTNQTAVPLSRLRVTRQSPSASFPSASTSSSAPRPTPSPAKAAPQNVPSIVVSTTTHTLSSSSSKAAALSSPKAVAPSAAVSAVPKLLPAPVLVPTAFSSRHITEPYFASSPPDEGSSRDATPRQGQGQWRRGVEMPVSVSRERERRGGQVGGGGSPGSGQRGRDERAAAAGTVGSAV